jgi:hypothetical protein
MGAVRLRVRTWLYAVFIDSPGNGGQTLVNRKELLIGCSLRSEVLYLPLID